MFASRGARTVRSTQLGFTLIELMVGLVIVGILLAAIAPAVARSARTHKVRTAATQMQTALMKARSSAVTRGSTIRMDIWPDSGLTITREDENSDGTFESMLGWNFLPSGIQMTSASFNGDTWISFGPQGVPSAAGTIRVETSSGLAREIRVAPGSGATTIEAPESAQDGG